MEKVYILHSFKKNVPKRKRGKRIIFYKRSFNKLFLTTKSSIPIFCGLKPMIGTSGTLKFRRYPDVQ